MMEAVTHHRELIHQLPFPLQTRVKPRAAQANHAQPEVAERIPPGDTVRRCRVGTV